MRTAMRAFATTSLSLLYHFEYCFVCLMVFTTHIVAYISQFGQGGGGLRALGAGLARESRGTGATFFHRLQNERRSLQKERRDVPSRRSVGMADAEGAQRAECPQPYKSILLHL